MASTDPGAVNGTDAEEAQSERVVRAFLTALEARDLRAADACLARGARMVFPGATEHRSLESVVRDAATRYRRVGKRIEAVETLAGGRVVYVRGTLHGVALNGEAFDGVRFIDRFELDRGRIMRHDVWNDLAESGVVKRRK